MRDDEARATRHEAIERVLNLQFGSRVDRRRRFVENEKIGAPRHDARDAQELAFPLREFSSVRRNPRVEAVRKTTYERVKVARARYLAKLRVGDIFSIHRDIFAHCARAKPRLLKHHPKPATQRRAR